VKYEILFITWSALDGSDAKQGMTANHAQYLSLLRGTWGLRGGWVPDWIGLDWTGCWDWYWPRVRVWVWVWACAWAMRLLIKLWWQTANTAMASGLPETDNTDTYTYTYRPRQFMKFSLIFDRREFLLMPRMLWWCALWPLRLTA